MAIVKRLLAILLLSCILYNSLGYFLVFSFQQSVCRKEIKRKIKAGLTTKDLIVLKFSTTSSANLAWINDHEFFYNEKLYDVISKKCDRGVDIFSCIDDTKEKELFANLEDKVKEDWNQKSQQGKSNSFWKGMDKNYFAGLRLQITNFEWAVYRMVIGLEDHYQFNFTADLIQPPIV